MRALGSAWLVGLLFGLGLGISGMTQSDKVIGFLDLADGWDPSLGFVMAGAIVVHLVLIRLILRRSAPMFARQFLLPTRADVDLRLVAGAALFGVGWALGGYCPGPGLVSLPSLAPHALAFVATLTLGMLAYQGLASLRRRS